MIRRVVLRRVRWRCEACGRWRRPPSTSRRQADQDGSDFDLDQLMVLCPPGRVQAPYALRPWRCARIVARRWEAS